MRKQAAILTALLVGLVIPMRSIVSGDSVVGLELTAPACENRCNRQIFALVLAEFPQADVGGPRHANGWWRS